MSDKIAAQNMEQNLKVEHGGTQIWYPGFR